MREELLDYENPNPKVERPYFKKSKKLFFYAILFFTCSLVVITCSIVSEQISDIITIPGIILVLLTMISNGLGIAAGVKSYYHKEKRKSARFWILIAHMILFSFYSYLAIQATYKTISFA